MDFAKRFELIFKAKEMSVKKLAKQSGLRSATIYPWLEGRTEPRGGSLIKLAQGLEVSTDFLLGIVTYDLEPRRIASLESRAIFFRLYGINAQNPMYNLYDTIMRGDSPPIDVAGWKNLHEEIIPTVMNFLKPKKAEKRKPSANRVTSRTGVTISHTLEPTAKILPLKQAKKREWPSR